MKMSDLQNMAPAELTERLAAERLQLHDIRRRVAEKQLKQVHQIAATRRLIARILTIRAARRSKPVV